MHSAAGSSSSSAIVPAHRPVTRRPPRPPLLRPARAGKRHASAGGGCRAFSHDHNSRACASSTPADYGGRRPQQQPSARDAAATVAVRRRSPGDVSRCARASRQAATASPALLVRVHRPPASARGSRLDASLHRCRGRRRCHHRRPPSPPPATATIAAAVSEGRHRARPVRSPSPRPPRATIPPRRTLHHPASHRRRRPAAAPAAIAAADRAPSPPPPPRPHAGHRRHPHRAASPARDRAGRPQICAFTAI